MPVQDGPLLAERDGEFARLGHRPGQADHRLVRRGEERSGSKANPARIARSGANPCITRSTERVDREAARAPLLPISLATRRAESTKAAATGISASASMAEADRVGEP